MAQKGFGCIEETPSCRTYTYNAYNEIVGGSKDTKIPKQYILPDDRLPDVLDQKNINACCAFVVAEIMQIFHRMEFNTDKAFSEGFIYGYNREESANIEGMYPDDLMKKLCKCGSVPKVFFDELKEMPEIRQLIKSNPNLPKLLEEAEKHKIAGYVGFTNKNKVEDIKAALYERNYPLFAVSKRYFGGSHAIAIIGWNEKGFVIQNSWGKSWRDNGRGTIPYSAIDYAYLMIDEVMKLNFKDVNENEWYYDAVKEVCFNGIMKGTSKDTFEPEKQFTRAEAAQFACNLMKRIDEILTLNKESK